MTLKKICAWCNTDLGEVESPDCGITHDICPSCRSGMKKETVLRVEHLEAGLTLEEDDHTLQLKEYGQVVALFTVKTDRDSILREADKYLPYQSV